MYAQPCVCLYLPHRSTDDGFNDSNDLNQAGTYERRFAAQSSHTAMSDDLRFPKTTSSKSAKHVMPAS